MADQRDWGQLFERAQDVIPGGVNSPVRAFGAVGGIPVFMSRAQGPFLYDVSGTRYIDYVGSWGPCILGHAHPTVVQAIQAAAAGGTSFGTATAAEVEMAELVCSMVPSIDKLRLVNSGTEATMTAIRLARAYTGQTRLIKFDGCYHGHSDSFLVRAGSGAATLCMPNSPGVPPAVAVDTLIAPFNSCSVVERLLLQHKGTVAAIIVEPVMGNAGVIPPEKGFLKGLRDLADKYGTLLIFDEVMTGFRVARGGAQALYGITPDLTTLGKVIGGGLPIGAVGGRRDIMNQLAPAGPVYQAGTLSGNPLAVAAGLATLGQLDDGLYEKLDALVEMLAQGICANLERHNVLGCVQRVGSMLCLFLGCAAVMNFEEAAECDKLLFARYYHAMLEQGIYLPPSPFEAFFVSAAHTPELIEQTIVANDKALAKALA